MIRDSERGAAWRPLLWIGLGTLLLVPLVAMQFTREVDWTGFDFAVAAVLLGVPALVYEVASRRMSGGKRLVLAAVLVAVTGLLWLQGAVGIV